MLRLTVAGRTIKDLKTQLQSAINELEGTIDLDPGAEFYPPPVEEDIEDRYNSPAYFEQGVSSVPAAPSMPVFKLPEAQSAPQIPTFKQIVEKASVEVVPPKQIVFDSPLTDAEGLAWDARIHSSNKKLTEKGVWTKRRGLDNETYYRIKGELRGQPITATPTIVPPIPAAPQVPVIAYESPVFKVGQPLPPETQQILQQPVYAPTVVAQTPVAAPVPEKTYENIPMPLSNERKQAHDLASFKATLPQSLARLINEGKLTQEYITSLQNYFKIDAIWKVNDAQLSEMFEQFAASGLITKVGP